MTFIFWQNILSIHQSAFINALSKKHDVILIAEKEVDSVRKQSGWTIPKIECLQIIVNPRKNEIEDLLAKYIDALHILSGLEVTFKQYKLTQKLVTGKYKVVCYLEPFNTSGIQRFLRAIKYKYLSIKYSRNLLAMLPTGEIGVEQYRNIGFKNIFEWGYFTESSRIQIKTYKNLHAKPKLLFVGSLDYRKNILFLLTAMRSEALKGIQLTIIGNGPLLSTVEDKAKVSANISYLGTKSNEEVKQLMCEHDILILPSVFDGWGAVVNEALTSGMRVICSNKCGAASLLRDKQRGSIFRSGDLKNFIEIMNEQLCLGVSTDKNRKQIISWCNSNISGPAAAEYFLNICSYILGKERTRPSAPWKN